MVQLGHRVHNGQHQELDQMNGSYRGLFTLYKLHFSFNL